MTLRHKRTPDDPPKRHRCPQCNYSANKPSQVTSHMATHGLVMFVAYLFLSPFSPHLLVPQGPANSASSSKHLSPGEHCGATFSRRRSLITHVQTGQEVDLYL